MAEAGGTVSSHQTPIGYHHANTTRQQETIFAALAQPQSFLAGSRLICLSGLPASGKTYLRTNTYPDIHYLDIADYYARGHKFPHAWRELLYDLDANIHKHKIMILEALLLPETATRKMIQTRYGTIIEFVDLTTDIATCRNRLENDVISGKITRSNFDLRIKLLENVG